MTSTIMIPRQHADFGMPAAGRAWTTPLRAFPVSATAASGGGAHLVGGPAAVTGEYSATDLAITTGAFPGLHAWSPPS